MNTNQTTLVVRGDRKLAIFVALMFTAIDAFMAYQLREELFDWKHLDTNALDAIVFVTFVVVTVMSWISLYLDLPKLKIDPTGIWKRRHAFSHTLKLMVTWDNISYYTTKVIPDRNLSTEDLVIRKKVPDEPVNIGIADIDTNRENILALLGFYSKQYGFNDFVEDLNSPLDKS